MRRLRGIWSLGLLLSIGAGCNLLASLIVLPVVLSLIRRRPAASITEPVGKASAA